MRRRDGRRTPGPDGSVPAARGKRLIEQVLHLLVREYRQSTVDRFNEWFENKLRLYGPSTVGPLTDLLHDDAAGVWGRIEAAGELSHIGWARPDTREAVLEALREPLPPLTDDGRPDVPGGADETPPSLWTTLTYGLGRHQGEASRAQIEPLFALGRTDEQMFGNVDAYRRLLRGEGGSWAAFEPASFDVVDYDDWYEEG
jgi:hypothetical protein